PESRSSSARWLPIKEAPPVIRMGRAAYAVLKRPLISTALLYLLSTRIVDLITVSRFTTFVIKNCNRLFCSALGILGESSFDCIVWQVLLSVADLQFEH